MVRSIYVLCFITLAAGLVHGAYDMEYFVNDVTSGIHNQDRFEQEIGVNYCMKTLISATEFIWDLFQQSTPEDRKSVQNITLTIEDMKGEAYTNTSNNEIHVSAGYILSYPAADVEGQRNEMNGVIYHQLTHDLWDIVEDGYEEQEISKAGKETQEKQQTYKENKKKDAKALFLIQQGVSKNLFPRLLPATTSKQAWEILKIEFKGSEKVISIKLQSLWREFDNLLMKDTESIQVFFTKVSGIVNQIKCYGDTIPDKKIVEKTLRSLPPKYDHVAAAIEESKDLSTLSLHELIGSLEAHEKRINRSTEQSVEQAFQSKAPRGLVEGIADYVRMKSGFIPSQWAQPGVGDRWDQGYDVTARFLEYLESLRNGFVTELNKKMRLGYSDDDFVQLLGKNVGQLWTEYKLRYAKR
ncbi:hypothetical protein L3X38_043931 [Prunus dulcis]|uniref:Uncharacterized protein n=1 Tax=Prunus dulcis TaxID=3755 RepID=A0AAD4YMQ5_PRUDU|nr:hypothetical protein L3X38_043931 [Prunus dulcis]